MPSRGISSTLIGKSYWKINLIGPLCLQYCFSRLYYVSDNTPLEETGLWPPWEEGEPNDAKSGEGCVESTNLGLWNDIKCSDSKVCLCEGKGMYLIFEMI